MSHSSYFFNSLSNLQFVNSLKFSCRSTTINSCDEAYDWSASLFSYIYTRICVLDSLGDALEEFAEAAAPAVAAVGTIGAVSFLAMPPLPMTLASGVPPGN